MSHILSHGTVTTRKSQRCFGCLEDFPKGSRTVRSVQVDDGIFAMYNCPLCDTLMGMLSESGFFMDGFEEGFALENRCITSENKNSGK